MDEISDDYTRGVADGRLEAKRSLAKREREVNEVYNNFLRVEKQHADLVAAIEALAENWEQRRGSNWHAQDLRKLLDPS